jgi:hypothetical protein
MSGCAGGLSAISDLMKHSIISCRACRRAKPRSATLKAASSSSWVSFRCFMGRSFSQGGVCRNRHRTGLDRPAILFPTAMQARAFLVGRARAGFSSLSRRAAGRAGGGAFLCLCGCVHVGSVRRGRGLVHHHERGTL